MKDLSFCKKFTILLRPQKVLAMRLTVKKTLKKVLTFLGLLAVAKLILRIVRSAIERIRLSFFAFPWYLHNYIVAYIPWHFLRILSCKHLLGVKIGKNVFIHFGVMFVGDITIGAHCVIGRNCYLGGPIKIGENVSITAGTYMFASTHIKDSPSFEGYYDAIVINDYAWLGARSMVLPGVSIGKGAVLGAQSTLTKNIPDFAVYAGSPAKEVGKRSQALEYELNYFAPFN